jgi:hypothetical protein
MEPDEARELIWPVPTKVFTNLLLSLVTTAYRTCRANKQTALLEMYVLTGSGHLFF